MANIKVAVRVRPISERELNFTGSKIVVRAQSNEISLTNLKVSSWKTGDSRERIKTYGFDYCFDSSNSETENYATQSKIYETLGESVLDSVFAGYNACLVAYGQSSSGKTYTMMGTKDDPGLTPRLCKGIFSRIAQEEGNDKTFQASVSYLEIYNERVRDLLKPTTSAGGLRVREHPRLGPYVQGLTRHKVSNLGSLMSYVEEGIKARKTASTLQNPSSSRSHALLTVSLSSVSQNGHSTSAITAKEKDFHRGSRLHLVDLAGSESAATCSGINRLKEGANINKSLVALGNVISALAERGSSGNVPGRRFIPYRDSSLTWLLKDALGGNATTIMFATISPASGSYNETAHTLRFAQRAQSVVNRPVVNEDPIARIIRELRSEVARLKSLLLEKELEGVTKPSCSCEHNLEQELEKEDQKDDELVSPLKRISSSHLLGEPKEIIKSSIRRYNSNESLVTRESRHSNSIRRCGSFESISPSISFANEGRSYRPELSESLNYQVNEPVFVDIPTLVAVLIKPENSSHVHSTQIEEVYSDGLLDGLIDTKLIQETHSKQDLSKNKNYNQFSDNSIINTENLNIIDELQINDPLFSKGKDQDLTEFTDGQENFSNSADNHENVPNNNELVNKEILNSREHSNFDVNRKRNSKDLASLPLKHTKKEKFNNFERTNKGKLRKQDSVDTTKKLNNLTASKIFGSVDGLSKKQEEPNLVQRAHTNLEKSKRLNNIKEVDDRRTTKTNSLWKGLGTSPQRKWSNDSDRSLKESHKTKASLRKYSVDDLKRKTSKDSSSSSSKEDQLISPLAKGNYSRKSSFSRGSDQDRPHTPIQRNRRAEIVAAVTERLYSSGKRSEEGTGATTPASDYRSPESTDVKLAAVTRMRLQEISRRMLAKRRKISADTQTDSAQTVRVKDKASLTDKPKIELKDAEVLTDKHEICERLIDGSQVVRVKEIATLTEKQKSPTIRYRDAGNITDDYDEDFDLHSPRNDSGILSDDTQNYADSNISDFDHETKRTECSTNTAADNNGVDRVAQTRREDLFLKSKETHCCCRPQECCSKSHSSQIKSQIENSHEHSHSQNINNLIQSNNCQKQTCTDKSVISINLPDMINITIESPNILESRISVEDENELRTNCRDCEVQTDERSFLERDLLTEDINLRPNISQTDGRTFRIENIFPESKTIRINPDSRITPRIRIVSNIEGDPSRSVILTKSIATSATGPKRCLNYQSPLKSLRRRLSFIRDRSFMDNYLSRRSRSFSPHRRTRSEEGIVKNWTRYPSSEIIQRLNPVQEVLLERAREGYLFSRSSRENEIWNNIRPLNQYFTTSPGEMNLFDGRQLQTLKVDEIRKDSYFSDDSLDLTEEKFCDDDKILEKGKDPCQPDLVAHTKENSKINVPDAMESIDAAKKKRVSFSTSNIVDGQNTDSKLSLTPKPIIKKKSDDENHQQNVNEEISVNEDAKIPIDNVQENVIGNEDVSIENENKFTDEQNFDDQDAIDWNSIKKKDLNDEQQNLIQNVIPRDLETQPVEIGKNDSILFEDHQDNEELVKHQETMNQNPIQKDIQDSFKEDPMDEENSMNDESLDENRPKLKNQRNILQDYLDEAVTFIRNVHSANDYATATNFLKKYLRTTRRPRRLLNKNNDYIEYAGQKISLKDDTDQYLIDDDIEIPNKAYEKCLQGIEKLEKCIEKVKDHEDSLKEKYGIGLEPAGAKLVLANSNQDLLEFLDHQCDNIVDSDNILDSDHEENLDINHDTYLGTNPGNPTYNWSYHNTNDGGLRYGSIPRSQFSNISKPQIGNQYRSQFGLNSKSMNFENYSKGIDNMKINKRFLRNQNLLKSELKNLDRNFDDIHLDDDKNYSRLSKINSIKTSDCLFKNFKTDDISLSKKWKSPASFRHSSLPRLTSSSNESFSSSETIAASSESIDNISNVGEQIKYPGSPRVKFLQLLNERRRIVENSRRANKS
ncbi:uncharacterized protein LOC127284835 [Leptopilina boulardi]|uniref:uncharacterized protein LOC127284835 n=1 Tax=Leptopilina boulardi TaxID=63433 RepID=UPI0021F58824|nr:uncharacterized protein LOC127284835 [Leptopilina boulardi]